MQEHKINQVTEMSHNQAMLTLIAERQELLYLRGRCAELERVIKEGQKKNNSLSLTLTEAQERIKASEEDQELEEEADIAAAPVSIDWGASPERRLAFLKECVESGSPVEIESPSGSKTTGVIGALKDDYTQLEFLDGATFQISKICHFEKISDVIATDEEPQD